ncbi:delta-lactam-biosynthetic de-N-acetylase [Cytobacillus spongiae]|jgi:peptidoglycan-N-acetylmuramic acid deacetylase|uniref:delta-lactam-biosynthetic de-N-acetylase n=1 Tax=Cytobacillus spongiae TaxID=2901381 RepID=UPI001F3D493B|nr:delta-lactam-biosynthetic de-N-acetylase [Cytobacillus spongiae]UII56536.1 delta-lactam-biosynthetic de-N-acetylase [Cytobacillus spongiae]
MRKIIKPLVILGALLLLTTSVAFGQYSNSPIHWGFKKGAKEQPADAGKELNELLKKYDSYYIGDTTKKEIYLTFDNGYENGYTAKILDVLKKERVPAAFFVTGHYLESAPDLVKRMVKEGHIVGNHSWHHPDLTKVSDEKLAKELLMVKEKTAELTGVKEMRYLRPPRGVLSERTIALAKKEGYTHVMWSLAFVDWHIDQQKGWEYSYNHIMKQIHPGAILLLHTVSKDNAEALEKVIQDLKKKGYRFKSLDDLTGQNPIDNEMLY